jgi:sugar phosphate isomerase/epimerase
VTSRHNIPLLRTLAADPDPFVRANAVLGLAWAGDLDSNAELSVKVQSDPSPWVRINLDTGNYGDPDPYQGLEASLPFAPHVVAKVRDLGPDGEDRLLDYDRIFALLKRHRYRGFVTVEYEGQQDERQGVAAAVQMLRRHAACHTV